MTLPRTIAALRRLAIIGLAEHGDEGVQALALKLLAYVESDEAKSLDDAVGLSTQRGEPGWRLARARNERNRLLRFAAAAFFPDAPPAAAAKALSAAWRDYWCGGWQADKRAIVCPDHVTGTLAEPFWRIMKAWPGSPLSAKQIAEVLRAETMAFEFSIDPQESSSQGTWKERRSS